MALRFLYFSFSHVACNETNPTISSTLNNLAFSGMSIIIKRKRQGEKNPTCQQNSELLFPQ